MEVVLGRKVYAELDNPACQADVEHSLRKKISSRNTPSPEAVSASSRLWVALGLSTRAMADVALVRCRTGFIGRDGTI